jgi:uncharacterized membrane protein
MSRRIEASGRCAIALLGVASCFGCVPTEQVRTDALSGVTRWIRELPPAGELVGGSGSSSYGAAGHGADVAFRPSGGQDYELTRSERRMREQSKNFERTVWGGALIGAAGGALWGVIGGDRATDVFKKAAIGAAVGGLAGTYIAHKQKQYSDKEDQLDSMIADVRASNRDAETLIVSTRDVLAEDKRRLASVKRQYKQGAATREDLQREKARIRANRDVVTKASGGAKEKFSMFKGAKREYENQNPGTDTKRFENELETYNEHIQALDELATDISVA